MSVDVDSDKGDMPEQAAKRLRKQWGIERGPVGHLVRAAENHGVLIIFSPPQTVAVDAYSFMGERPTVVLNPAKWDYYRQRFDVAHELGHLVMHLDAEPGGKVVEAQAHRFAAEFLMPGDQIADLLPGKADYRKLASLKEEWGVSMQALLYRARALGVMGDVTYRNALAYMSSKGWRRREPGPMPPMEQPSLFPRAVEILRDVGIGEDDLAREARVPLELFRVISARAPFSGAGGELEEIRDGGKVVSVFPKC
ncbi:ImmA/IrrE family metallo-endopeptidase [Streptomyces sp. URMC 129]|uniref:ImmA/IrrE family metallo-endopeptidase n=1 Tax=Streptomyces sp. URMC 129 TaxID=3423407 RepID=UPI003F1B1DBC